MNVRSKACYNRDSDVVSASSCGKTNDPCRPLASGEHVTPLGYQYIRVSDADLYLHAVGGPWQGARQALWTCSKAKNYGNCQWEFEKSRHNKKLYYIRISNGRNYMHAHGGSNEGAMVNLHPCDPWRNYPNCQWRVKRVPKKNIHTISKYPIRNSTCVLKVGHPAMVLMSTCAQGQLQIYLHAVSGNYQLRLAEARKVMSLFVCIVRTCRTEPEGLLSFFVCICAHESHRD